MGKIFDRVLQTSTSEGTGSFEITGTVSGYNTFIVGAGLATSDTSGPWIDVNYQIEQRDSGGSIVDWEIGAGVLYKNTAGNPYITRDTVRSSSNGGALVDFGSGTKNIWNAPQAADFYGDLSLASTNASGAGALSAAELPGYSKTSGILTDFDYDHDVIVIQAPIQDKYDSIQWLPTADNAASFYFTATSGGPIYFQKWKGFVKVHHQILDFGSMSSGTGQTSTATLDTTLINYQRAILLPNFQGSPNVEGDARVDHITTFNLASNTTASIDCDLNDSGTLRLCASIIEF